jgi:hypothetical protein
MENMDKKSDKYKSIMIKLELKEIMDSTIIKIGKKMSYGQLIEYLIENYNEENGNETM